MKMTRVALVLCCVMIVYGVARAQDNSQAPQVLDDLKLQLIDVQAKQEAVTEQIQQLDEALKPENIEHSLAGFGSTRPEELREQRRRQLLKEKTSLAAELTALNDKRAKLEEAIADAEKRKRINNCGPVMVRNFLSEEKLVREYLVEYAR